MFVSTSLAGKSDLKNMRGILAQALYFISLVHRLSSTVKTAFEARGARFSYFQLAFYS
jgi:hypothetical protein